MDFYTDTGSTMLYNISKIQPLPQFVKEGSILEKKEIPSRAFAWPEKRAFPIVDAASSWLSYAYLQMNRNQLSEQEAERCESNIIKAASFFDIPSDVMSDLRDKFDQSKLEKQAQHTNSGYALPEKEAFPLHTKLHVELAVEKYAELCEDYSIAERLQIAREVVKKASEHEIPVNSRPKLKNDATGTLCNSVKAAMFLKQRCLVVDDIGAKRNYINLANGLHGNAGNHDLLCKVAGVIEGLDKLYGIEHLYANNITPPIQTIFNFTEKQALDMKTERPINIAGESWSLDALADVPLDNWSDLFGEDFASTVRAENGTADPDKLETIIGTLPAPEKKILNTHLKKWIATTPIQE